MKKWIWLLLAACLLISIPCAADGNLTVAYDDTEDSVVFYEADTGKGGFINLMIVPSGTELETVTVDTENVIYRTVEADENGMISGTILLPAELPNGRYDFYVSGTGFFAMETFTHMAADVSAELIKQLNAAARNELYALIKENREILGIDAVLLEEVGEEIAVRMFDAKPAGGYTLEEFEKRYMLFEAHLRLQKETIGLEQLLREYSAWIVLDGCEPYEDLSDAVQAELEELLKKETLADGDFETAYAHCLILAQIRQAKDYNAVKTVFLQYCTQNEVSLTQYQSLENDYYRNNVFMEMYSRRSSIDSVARAVQVFNEAVSSQQKSTSGSTGGTGSAGRGSASGNGGVHYTPAQSSEVPTDDPNRVQTEFSDIEGHWAADYILDMAAHGIVQGLPDGSFQPEKQITRAEFIKMAVGVLSLETVETSLFSDVEQQSWYYGYVGAAAQSGIVTGVGAGLFSPEQEITREDAALIAVRMLSSKGVELEGTWTFSDAAEISDYAAGAVNALAANGILTGDGGKMRPQDSISRAEAAALFSRLISVMEGGK